MTIVTKANIVKLADGNFIKAVRKVGEEYPEIEIQERLVDAMCAKMLDPEFNKGIEVIVLPNLYGDIVTDVAAEHQGGLGTASSSNLGNKYAMFEAIHGTAPYLISHGRGEYADPCSLDPGGGNAAGPHRLRRPQEKTGRRAGHLHQYGAQGGPDHHAPRDPSTNRIHGLCN